MVYDQHDFVSFKHRLSRREKRFEKTCNEKADGVIYVTQSYKNGVAKYYSPAANSLCFANYYPAAAALKPNDRLPRLSCSDGRLHLVYAGGISERAGSHRNVLALARALSDRGCLIHIYPSRDKEYRKYREIPGVIVHDRMPYGGLIRELSQYDFGLTVFNEHVPASALPHIAYAMGNKTCDYLCAGIPVLVQGCLQEARSMVVGNGFGFVLEDWESHAALAEDAYGRVVDNVMSKRDQYAIERQIDRVVRFYQVVIRDFERLRK